MSDNWKPPPGRDDPEPEGEQPTEPPAQPPSHRDGQSPLWWTESAEKPQEYLQPGPPASASQPPATPNTPQNRPAPQGGSSGWDTPSPNRGPATPDRPTEQGGWTSADPRTANQPPYSGQQSPRGQHAAPPAPAAGGPTARPAAGGPTPGDSTAGGPPNSGPVAGGPGASGRAGGPAAGGPPAGGPAAGGPAAGGPVGSGRPAAPRHQAPAGSGYPPPRGYIPPGSSTPPQSPWSSAPQGGTPQPNPWSGAASTPYPPAGQQGGPAGSHGGQPGFQGFPPANGPAQGGQPSWQYPPIPIPKPPGSGRRRKPRRTPKGLLIGLVVLAVLIVGSGVTYALRNNGDDNKVTVSDTPSATPSESPSETPSETPSASPTPTPTVKPKPRQPTPYELVAKNKLYTVGTVQASKCTEPPYRPTTFAAVKAYYNRMLPCLNRTWWLAMQKAKLPFRAPHVIVYANTVKTPCGIERGTRGFYCSANEAIYMPFNVDYNNYKVNPMYTRAWMLNTFAHEYGHHVQQLSGIFGASFARQATMADPAMRLLESRKRELQASCLGSAYLGADAQFIPLKGELLASWKFAVANAGDEFSKPKVRDHGAKVNHNFWSTRGISFRNPRYCNTFQSPPQYTY